MSQTEASETGTSAGSGQTEASSGTTGTAAGPATSPSGDPAGGPAGSHLQGGSAGSSASLDERTRDELKQAIVEVLKGIYDPEIPVDIYELGLIYEVAVDEHGIARIQMTLTSPACPVAGSLPPEVEVKTAAVDGVKRAEVELVWDPPWTPERMSEAARLQLNFF